MSSLQTILSRGLRNGRIRLALTPQSIQATGQLEGDAVLSLGDATHQNTPGLPLGTPTLYTSGPVRGVRLDNASDAIAGAVSLGDQSSTVYLVYQTIIDAPAYAWVVDFSDNGTIGRSIAFERVYTNTMLAQQQVSTANAAYIPTSIARPIVQRGRCTTRARSMYEDGRAVASSLMPSPPVRNINGYRVGQQMNGANPWNGVLYYLLVVEWYDEPSLLEEEEIEKALREEVGIPDPFELPKATAEAGDPRLLLPPVIEALAGDRVELIRDNVHLRDGAATQAMQSELPRAESTDDRWAYQTPEMPGEFGLKLIEGSYSAASKIVTKPMPAIGVSTKRVLVAGDSITNRAFNGGFAIPVGAELGSRIVFCGTKTPVSPWPSYKHEGIDGATWGTFATSGSPFFNGGAAFDIPGYTTAIGGAPDLVPILCGQNDWYLLASEADVDAQFATSMVHAEAIFAAMRATWPNVLFAVCTGFPLATNPALGLGTWSARLTKRAIMHRWAEKMRDYFTPKAADGYSILPTLAFVDGVRGYYDAIHPSPEGMLPLADAMRAMFVHKLWP